MTGSDRPRLHLQKLCVGAESMDDLKAWVDRRLHETGEHRHVTRMTPKRGEELLAGGSLYWVIKGVMQCRQRILELRPVTGEDGIRRCAIVLDPDLVATRPRPRRPFQGWRYLTGREAPADLPVAGADAAGMPEAMRRDLVELGLI